jgi:hypothetical protein
MLRQVSADSASKGGSSKSAFALHDKKSRSQKRTDAWAKAQLVTETVACIGREERNDSVFECWMAEQRLQHRPFRELGYCLC